VYLAATIGAGGQSEEAFLRQKFGDQYDRYRRGDRRASIRRAIDAAFSAGAGDRESRAPRHGRSWCSLCCCSV
jgi:hypothetical protein